MQRRERRRIEREPVVKAIQYILIPALTNEPQDGVVSDMSIYGICMLSIDNLESGQQVMIKDDLILKQMAIVRWSKKKNNIFQIGLEFN